MQAEPAIDCLDGGTEGATGHLHFLFRLLCSVLLFVAFAGLVLVRVHQSFDAVGIFSEDCSDWLMLSLCSFYPVLVPDSVAICCRLALGILNMMASGRFFIERF